MNRFLTAILVALAVSSGLAVAGFADLLTATSALQSKTGAAGTRDASLTFELDGLSKDISVNGSFHDSNAISSNGGFFANTSLKLYDDETGTLLTKTPSFNTGSGYKKVTLANNSLDKAVRRVRLEMDSEWGGSTVDLNNVSITYTYDNDPSTAGTWINTSAQSNAGGQSVDSNGIFRSLASSLTFELPVGGTTAIVVRGSYGESNPGEQSSRIEVLDDETGMLLMDSGKVQISGTADKVVPIVLSNYSIAQSVRRIRVEMFSYGAWSPSDYVKLSNVVVSYKVSDAEYHLNSSVTENQTKLSAFNGDDPISLTFNLNQSSQVVIVRGSFEGSGSGTAQTKITVTDADTGSVIASSGWIYTDTNGGGSFEHLVLSNWSTSGVKKVKVQMTSKDQQPWDGMKDVNVEYATSSNLIGTVQSDVDGDDNKEKATDGDGNSTNGFETYNDADGSSTATTIDGDGDGKTDFLVDTDKDGTTEKYWDPDGNVLTNVTAVDVDGDGTLELLLDTDDDGSIDTFYDPGTLTPVTSEDVNGDGTDDLLLDTDGDGTPDTWYNPTDGSVNPYPVDNGNNQPPDNGNGGSGGGGGGGGGGSGGSGSSGGSSGTNGGGSTTVVRDFDLSIAPSNLEMQAGNMALLTITLHNSGTAALSGITFEVSGLPDGWYVVPGSMPALGFTDQIAEWRIAVPAGMADGSYEVKLTATSNENATDTATFLLVIKEPVPAEEPEVEPQNEQPSPLTSLLTMVNSPLAITALVITALAAATAFKQRDRVARWYHELR